MASLPFFPFWYQDYLSKTMPQLSSKSHLTNEEHGIYLLLILAYWIKGCALTLDEVLDASRCDRNATALKRIEKFFVVSKNEDFSELWFHQRIEGELAKARENTEESREKSEKAIKSANARWKKEKEMRMHMHNECERNAIHNHTQNHTHNHSEKINKKDFLIGQGPAIEIFSYWIKKSAGRHADCFDSVRKKYIYKMLRYFSVDDLKLAIDGCSLDPFHNGELNGQILDSIDIIFKSVDKVERFIALAKNPPTASIENKRVSIKYETFLSETNDDNVDKFVEILKRAESENRYDLTLDEIKMYYKHLKTFCLGAISGAFDDFQSNRTQYDGKFPKVKILIDYARQRERGMKISAEADWGHLIHWISKEWRISEMDPCKTRIIMIENEEMRKQLPEKLEDFYLNEKAKEKFIELFLKIEERV
jgi:uncharacterized protein YdaU (DUF1376 family)